MINTTDNLVSHEYLRVAVCPCAMRLLSWPQFAPPDSRSLLKRPCSIRLHSVSFLRDHANHAWKSPLNSFTFQNHLKSHHFPSQSLEQRGDERVLVERLSGEFGLALQARVKSPPLPGWTTRSPGWVSYCCTGPRSPARIALLPSHLPPCLHSVPILLISTPKYNTCHSNCGQTLDVQHSQFLGTAVTGNGSGEPYAPHRLTAFAN